MWGWCCGVCPAVVGGPMGVSWLYWGMRWTEGGKQMEFLLAAWGVWVCRLGGVFRCHPASQWTRIVWDGEDVMHDATPEATPLVTGGFQIRVWEFVLLRCWFSGSFAAGTDPSSRLPRLRNAP